MTHGQKNINKIYASFNKRGYVLRNASLGDFFVVRKCTYTNLDIIAYCTPRLYGIAYRSLATNLYSIFFFFFFF
jgi:hypothetical protein